MNSSGDPQREYKLVIWFDPKQVGIDEVWGLASTRLPKRVRKDVGYSIQGYLTLSLTGTLEEIDESHSQITDFVSESNWNMFRVIDTAGDEIRRQAYVELSQIEQKLRLFVNTGLIDAFGFDWWASLGSLEIPGMAGPELQKTHHRLELMTINDLVDFVTFRKAQWDNEKPIAVADLARVLNESNSFDEFRAKVFEKTNETSMWDLVFSKYLGEKASVWQDMSRTDLKFVIELRNKVMHHRPVRLGELRGLREKRQKIADLFASARTCLSEEEKREISSQEKEAREIFAHLLYERGPQNAYARLYDSLSEARNIDTISNLAREVDELKSLNSLTAKDALELKALSFERYRSLTSYNLEETQQIILGQLLPLCLHEDPELSWQYRALRTILVDWINGHAEEDCLFLRDHALDRLAQSLGTEEHGPACWIISTLGFGRPDIVQEMLDFGLSANSQRGDDSLYALTWLNLTPEQSRSVLEELHRRAKLRFSSSLSWSMARLKDGSSLSVIVDEWLRGNRPTEKQVDPLLAFNAIREIADANDENNELQQGVWDLIKHLIEQSPRELYFPFALSGEGSTVNSEQVIPTLLGWHGRHGDDWFDNPGWAHYLMQRGLEDYIKPRQLAGWGQTESLEILGSLRRDACADTGQDLTLQTIQSMQKMAAWGTILRAGCEDALSWFDEAVGGETARFVRADVMKYFACFRIDPLPRQVIDWITQLCDQPNNADGRELAYRMAAVQMARSAATREAFTALLDFGFTYDGQVLYQSSDAVAEVAIALAQQGDQEIIDELVEVATESSSPRQRLVCAYALDVMSTIPELASRLLPYVETMTRMLDDEQRDDIERGMLLDCLSRIPDWEIPDSLIRRLLEWAKKSDGWVSKGSMEALLSHRLMQNYPELMRTVLGIDRGRHGWELVQGVKLSDWAYDILGQSYQADPESYTNVVRGLLAERDWLPTAHLLSWLASAHDGAEKPEIPDLVVTAMLDRVRELHSHAYAETEILDVLSSVAPGRLANEHWEGIIDDWIPEAQVSLANALGHALVQSEEKARCLEHLGKLAESRSYAVRRAAYRGLAKQSMEHLYELCRSWSISSVVDLRIRAAEACGWIDYVPQRSQQDGFSEILAVSSVDPEPRVRHAAQRASEERRRRRWARKYLAIVLNVSGQSNREILGAWCYGEALARIGDDECQEALHEHISNAIMPPNVRYWLRHILEQMQNSWKKITQDWPKGWTDMSGVIESGEGKLVLQSNREIVVKYSIWGKMRVAPYEKRSWGGIMRTSLVGPIALDKGTIQLADKRKGDIVVTSISNDTVSFVGTGAYPS